MVLVRKNPVFGSSSLTLQHRKRRHLVCGGIGGRSARKGSASRAHQFSERALRSLASAEYEMFGALRRPGASRVIEEVGRGKNGSNNIVDRSYVHGVRYVRRMQAVGQVKNGSNNPLYMYTGCSCRPNNTWGAAVLQVHRVTWPGCRSRRSWRAWPANRTMESNRVDQCTSVLQCFSGHRNRLLHPARSHAQ